METFLGPELALGDLLAEKKPFQLTHHLLEFWSWKISKLAIRGVVQDIKGLVISRYEKYQLC